MSTKAFIAKASLMLVLAVPVLCPAAASAQEPDPNIKSDLYKKVEVLELVIGAQQVISSDDVRSYSEGRKGIVDIRLTKDNSQFIIVGLRAGETTLLFLMMDGTEKHMKIKVEDPDRRKGSAEGTVEARDNIRLDFYFVQVNKSYGHQLGFGWPGQIAPPQVSASYDFLTGTFGSASAVISDVPLPYLDIAQSSGWAKIMRQAAVVTTNGERASFEGGGEVNVLVQSSVGTGLQHIQFGALVEVEPVYDSESGRIELRLHADVAELDDDRGTGVPGRITTALDTVVNLELGQSLVLGGLTAKSKRRSKSGLPGLSQIPVIGFLFGSQNQAEEESESIVIIVPTVVDAVSMSDRKRIKDALSTYEDYSGDIDKVKFIPEAKVVRPSPAKGAP